MRIFSFLFFYVSCVMCVYSKDPVELGVDVFFKEKHYAVLKDKKIGLLTNHSGMNRDLIPTVDLFKEKKNELTLTAIFSPEHGIHGQAYAGESVKSVNNEEIPIFSLHGATRRPTEKMLKNIDVIIYDIQEIGCRAYTYTTTLFYVMEEAVKHNISVIVLDRPNPIGGDVVDGPMLDEKQRSFVGHINVPYCHGMTIGELAQFFNEEYKVGCDLQVISMKGWTRDMSFADTGLPWVPTSPNIPESDTPYFCASTGILGEIDLVNIGIGYTMPFKVVGAPWIDAKKFASSLNRQNLAGVCFIPFFYRPFYGSYKNQDCQGVKIIVTDKKKYRPLSVQYLILGMLKSLYPKKIEDKLAKLTNQKRRMFCLVNGNEKILQWLENEKYIAWKCIEFQKKEREEFIKNRKKYLLY